MSPVSMSPVLMNSGLRNPVLKCQFDFPEPKGCIARLFGANLRAHPSLEKRKWPSRI